MQNRRVRVGMLAAVCWLVAHITVHAAEKPVITTETPAFDKTAQATVVLGLSQQYWQQVNSQQYWQVYAQFSPKLKQDISFEQWLYSQKQLAQKIGTLTGQADYQLTWYENPPQLPAGWYAAVDYVMPYAQAQLCGFLVWRHQADDSYLLQRIETNFIENTTAKGMSPQDTYALKQQMGCRL